MKNLPVSLGLLVLFSNYASAQTDGGSKISQSVSKSELNQGLRGNNIVIGQSGMHPLNTRRMFSKPPSSISISGSVLSEVGNTVKGLYNMQNKVAGIRVGNPKKQQIDLRSNVGLKGWEANGSGSFSKKRSSTFNIKYQYSLEDMLMQGMGHQLKLVTEF